MNQPRAQPGGGPDEKGGGGQSGVRLHDLEGRQRGAREEEHRRKVLRSRLNLHRYAATLRGLARALRDYIWHIGQVRVLVVASLIAFSLSILLGSIGARNLALLPVLAGFGLSLAALLYGAVPPIASRLDALDRSQGLVVWAFVVVVFAFVGFSSAVVIVLVLFVGGFTATQVYWNLLNRLLLWRGRRKRRGIAEATANPVPFLVTFGAIAAWSGSMSLLMGVFGLHESRPLGIALLAAHIGLVLGLVPTQVQLLREVQRPSLARWSLFRPARLLRDVLFTAVAGAVVGAELAIASGGGVFSGIPTLALVLVLFGYLGVVARQMASFGGRVRPFHPLVLPAFGLLLLFAPLVVLLSNPPGTLTRLYGAAQAAGILSGVATITLRGLWQERTRRLRARLEEALKERIPLERLEERKEDSYERIGGSRSRGDGDRVATKEAVTVPKRKGGPGRET